MLEHFFLCPYCNAHISMLVDPSVAHQQYIEDCEVCCNPIKVNVSVDEGEVIDFYAESIEQ